MHLHVAHILSVALWGGPSQVVVNLLAEGHRRGWTMTLVLFEHPGAALERLSSEAREAGAEVVRLPLGGAFDPRLGTKLRALLRRLDPDVVHCHGYKPALAALLAEPRSRRACVLTVHGWSARHWRLGIYEWLERRILAPRFGRVFVVSQRLRDWLLELGLPPEKVVLIPNAFDPSRYGEPARAAIEDLRRSWGLVPGQPAVGALGRLSLEKGHDVLIRAMAGLPGTRLVLIGDGPVRPDLERLADQLRLQPRPVFAGETDRPLTALAALDVVVLPSRTEGLPQSLLEAMALGRPVVASAVGAVPDALDHGGAGLLVPPEDPGALRAALARLLNDADLARRLAAAAHERVMRIYTPQALGDRLEGEYRALLDRPDAGSGAGMRRAAPCAGSAARR